jgi:hypothetical protein
MIERQQAVLEELPAASRRWSAARRGQKPTISELTADR